MKIKIKFLSITIIFMLIFSTVCFATSNTPSLISTQDETINEADTDDSVINTIDSDTTQELIDNNEIVDGNEEINEEYYDYDNNEIDDQIIEEDYFKIDNDIVLKKIINGNVYLIGDRVDISSQTLAGNVFVIANSVDINSDIYMSLYVMANSVNIKSGEIVDAYIMASNVNIGENAEIDRDAKIIAETLTMDGIVYKNLYSLCTKTTINGAVNENLTYTGELEQGEESVINSINKIETQTKDNFEEKIDAFKSSMQRAMFVWKTFNGLIIILIIFLLTKKCIRINKIDGEKTLYYTEKTFSTNDVIDILKGILYIVLGMIAIILLLVTIIGIPVGLLLLIVYIITIYISKPVACIEIAKLFKIKTDSEGKQKAIIILLSALIYILLILLTRVSVIGPLVYSIVGLYGLGTIVNFVFFRKNNNCCITKQNTSVDEISDKNEKLIVNENTDKTDSDLTNDDSNNNDSNNSDSNNDDNKNSDNNNNDNNEYNNSDNN